jgi:hypothetical protein
MFDVNDISCMLSLVIYYPILLLLYVIVMYDGLEIVYREIMHVKKIIYLNLVIIENFILKFFVYH